MTPLDPLSIIKRRFDPIMIFFSGFLAHLFLKEDISIIHFYSGLLIVAGIVTANHESKKA